MAPLLGTIVRRAAARLGDAMEMWIGLNAESTLLAACCLLVSLTALSYVQFRFSEGRRVPLASKQTGAQIARTILQENGVFGVDVVQAEGFLNDHYDPVERRLSLSPQVYGESHATAAGVAAHEAGHALQQATQSASLMLRSALLMPASVGSGMAENLIVLGLAMSGFRRVVPGTVGYGFAMVGICLFVLCLLFSLAMLVNEIDASRRARAELIRLKLVSADQELLHVDRVLRAAAYTYVGFVITSAMHVAFWLLRAFIAREDD